MNAIVLLNLMQHIEEKTFTENNLNKMLSIDSVL